MNNRELETMFKLLLADNDRLTSAIDDLIEKVNNLENRINELESGKGEMTSKKAGCDEQSYTLDLYQVKTELLITHSLKRLAGKIDRSNVDGRNYEHVYSGKSSLPLEEMAQRLNLYPPEDFYGRSISFSDIIVVDGKKVYYYDENGWVSLPDDFIEELD